MSNTSLHSPRLRRLLFLGLVLIALASSPFLYQKIKSHRANKLAAKSINLSAAGSSDEARTAAEAAFNLDPASPATLRARARSAKSPIDTFFFSNALLQTDGATPADVRLYLETCLELNFGADIDSPLNRLLDTEPRNIDNWLLAAEINLLRDQRQLALNCATQALGIDANNRQAKLLAGKIANTSSESQFRGAAVESLKRLITEDPTDQIGLDAQLELLPSSANEVILHPLATVENQLLAANHLLYSASNETQRLAITQQTIERHKTTNLAPLIHWLNQSQQPKLALELANYDQARTSSDLFTAWTHAMIADNRSSELISLVEDPKNHSQIPLQSDALQLILVDAFEANDKASIAEIHWTKLLRDANTGDRVSKLVHLAQWAERHQYEERALSIYETLLSVAPSYVAQWYDRIAIITRELNQLPRLHQITRTLLEKYPENIVYQHNYAYLSALAGTDLDRAADLLQALIKLSPNADSARCALALIEKNRGNASATQAQLDAVKPDYLDPNSKFIFLTLSGQNAIPPATITAYEVEALQR